MREECVRAVPTCLACHPIVRLPPFQQPLGFGRHRNVIGHLHGPPVLNHLQGLDVNCAGGSFGSRKRCTKVGWNRSKPMSAWSGEMGSPPVSPTPCRVNHSTINASSVKRSNSNC